jgi:hypothetical protein
MLELIPPKHAITPEGIGFEIDAIALWVPVNLKFKFE